MPLVDRPKEWDAITRELQRAEKHFRDGDYNPCVASCRLVLDELGHLKFGPGDWAGPLLDRIAKDRGGMTGGEREACCTALRASCASRAERWGRAAFFAAGSAARLDDGGDAGRLRAGCLNLLVRIGASG